MPSSFPYDPFSASAEPALEAKELPPPVRALPYAEDLQDAFFRAGQLQKQQPGLGKESEGKPSAAVTEKALLVALCQQSRLFSQTQALLGQLGTSPKGLLKALKAYAVVSPRPLAPMVSAAHHAVERGARTVSALLMLETILSEPSEALMPVLAQVGIVPAQVALARRQVQRNPWPRRLLFVGKELGEMLLLVFVCLVIIRETLGEPRLIPSESMVPTLKVGDRVMIEKLSHWWRPYQRGDVLVFYPPSTQIKNDPVSWLLRASGFSSWLYQKEDNIDVAYIKRLIGLPGDTVDVRPGEGVFINGQHLNEPYVNEIALTCTQEAPVIKCGPLTLGSHEFFMMGDNRNFSSDSRFWGPLPQQRVVGRAVYKLWPLARLGSLTPPAVEPH